MIEIIKGNLLDSNSNIIVQQVNCQGVMGAGLAKQIKSRHPIVFIEYSKICNKYKPEELLGKVLLNSTDHKGNCVASLFGQLDYGTYKVQTDYKALENCFLKLRNRTLDDHRNKSTTIGIPYKIGCGLAGGDWNIVYEMTNRIFRRYEDRVKIYKL